MQEIRLAVVGSRNILDEDYVYEVLEELTEELFLENIRIIKVVSGGAIGIDSIAEQWAYINNIDTDIYRPDWKRFGKAAGFIRNTTIVENCDIMLAIWDGKSKGTLHSMSQAKKLKKRLIIEKLPE